MKQAKPAILEPIMAVNILVPDEMMGDIMGDLNGRRGRVMGTEQVGKRQLIKATVPLSEMTRYQTDLKSMTSARGSYTMELERYEQAPSDIQEKVIAQAKSGERGVETCAAHKTAPDIQAWRAERQRETIGFVPTMGALHEGHLSLVRAARAQNDCAAVSVYVNPIQFNIDEDLRSYPRQLEKDAQTLSKEGVDILFAPDNRTIYPDGFSTYVQVEGPIADRLCGAARPGHFRGVATVVSKLFHLVQPDRAYFGQKDAQQLALIRKMTRDMAWDIQIVPIPTVREPDGLALSSRNARLSSEQRAQAPKTVRRAPRRPAKSAAGRAQRSAAPARNRRAHPRPPRRPTRLRRAG